MAHPQKAPLRSLTAFERAVMEQVARSQTEPAAHVARAQVLLAVADGASFADAARAIGRRSGRGVTPLVARFNRLGLAALERQPGGGAVKQYRDAERERILREFQRTPDRERDGTATWSLQTLQRVLRQAPDGLPAVSTFTIFCTLHEAGYTFQNNRTWCQTGTVRRKRRAGVVTVTDPLAEEKGDGSSEPIP